MEKTSLDPLIASRAQLLARPRRWVAFEPACDESTRAMLDVFDQAGGVAGGDELVCLMRPYEWQPTSTVARWIVEREVVCLAWRGQILLPLFQFDLPMVRLKREVSNVIGELVGDFNGREIAAWFSSPNGLLDGALPVKRIASDSKSVIEAARFDRFALKG